MLAAYFTRTNRTLRLSLSRCAALSAMRPGGACPPSLADIDRPATAITVMTTTTRRLSKRTAGVTSPPMEGAEEHPFKTFVQVRGGLAVICASTLRLSP